MTLKDLIERGKSRKQPISRVMGPDKSAAAVSNAAVAPSADSNTPELASKVQQTAETPNFQAPPNFEIKRVQPSVAMRSTGSSNAVNTDAPPATDRVISPVTQARPSASGVSAKDPQLAVQNRVLGQLLSLNRKAKEHSELLRTISGQQRAQLKAEQKAARALENLLAFARDQERQAERERSKYHGGPRADSVNKAGTSKSMAEEANRSHAQNSTLLDFAGSALGAMAGGALDGALGKLRRQRKRRTPESTAPTKTPEAASDDFTPDVDIDLNPDTETKQKRAKRKPKVMSPEAASDDFTPDVDAPSTSAPTSDSTRKRKPRSRVMTGANQRFSEVSAVEIKRTEVTGVSKAPTVDSDIITPEKIAETPSSSKLGKLGKGLGRVAVPVALATGAVSAVSDLADPNKSSKEKAQSVAKTAAGTAGGWAGGEIGAATGAALGTMLFPGLGTVAGGILGGLGGGALGFFGGESLADTLMSDSKAEGVPENLQNLVINGSPHIAISTTEPLKVLGPQSELAAPKLAVVSQQPLAQSTDLNKIVDAAIAGETPVISPHAYATDESSVKSPVLTASALNQSVEHAVKSPVVAATMGSIVAATVTPIHDEARKAMRAEFDTAIVPQFERVMSPLTDTSDDSLFGKLSKFTEALLEGGEDIFRSIRSAGLDIWAGLKSAGNAISEGYQQGGIMGAASALPKAAGESYGVVSKAFSSVGSNFDKKAPAVMNRLMEDLHLTKEQAAGIVGNLGHESAGMRPDINEANPVIPGSRGGYGWAQWTGDRRVAFERFAAQNGLDIKSDEANYRFLVHELQTSHRSTLDALRQTNSAYDAAHIFEDGYEGAKIKNYASRERFAEKALEAYARDGGKTSVISPETQQAQSTQPSAASASVTSPVTQQAVTPPLTSFTNPNELMIALATGQLKPAQLAKAVGDTAKPEVKTATVTPPSKLDNTVDSIIDWTGGDSSQPPAWEAKYNQWLQDRAKKKAQAAATSETPAPEVKSTVVTPQASMLRPVAYTPAAAAAGFTDANGEVWLSATPTTTDRFSDWETPAKPTVKTPTVVSTPPVTSSGNLRKLTDDEYQRIRQAQMANPGSLNAASGAVQQISPLAPTVTTDQPRKLTDDEYQRIRQAQMASVGMPSTASPVYSPATTASSTSVMGALLAPFAGVLGAATQPLANLGSYRPYSYTPMPTYSANPLTNAAQQIAAIPNNVMTSIASIPAQAMNQVFGTVRNVTGMVQSVPQQAMNQALSMPNAMYGQGMNTARNAMQMATNPYYALNAALPGLGSTFSLGQQTWNQAQNTVRSVTPTAMSTNVSNSVMNGVSTGYAPPPMQVISSQPSVQSVTPASMMVTNHETQPMAVDRGRYTTQQQVVIANPEAANGSDGNMRRSLTSYTQKNYTDAGNLLSSSSPRPTLADVPIVVNDAGLMLLNIGFL
jgi:hypothetical protein